MVRSAMPGDRKHRAQRRLLPEGAHMTAPAASPNGHRVLAVIAPGAGPHLIGQPAVSHWTTRPARSRVSLADELADCLTTLEQDPERFQCAAARWHALWCIDLETL